jgi:DNA-binding NarL/FixJ family response regulator
MHARILRNRGKFTEMHKVFSIGLESLRCPAGAWLLLLEIIQHGTRAHVIDAQKLLRAFDSTSLVAKGHTALLRARVESDGGNDHALEAARIFAELGWRYHQAVALEIAGIPSEARHIYINIGASTDAERLRGAKRVSRGRPGRSTGSLTQRQRDIVQLLAREKSNSDIATLLGITRKTVRDHMSAILATAGVADREELVEWSRSVFPRSLS